MEFDVAALGPQASYHLALSTIVPRPIAWVTSVSAGGVVNLAPFSFFAMLSDDPLLLGVSIGPASRGGLKDTAANIRRNGEFVVHTADEALCEAVELSSGEYGPEQSEVELAGLALEPAAQLTVPRIARAPAAHECRLHRVVELDGSVLYIGRVVAMRIHDRLLVDGRVQSMAMRPLARMGNPRYAGLRPLAAPGT